jgi:hypothetical protein
MLSTQVLRAATFAQQLVHGIASSLVPNQASNSTSKLLELAHVARQVGSSHCIDIIAMGIAAPYGSDGQLFEMQVEAAAMTAQVGAPPPTFWLLTSRHAVAQGDMAGELAWLHSFIFFSTNLKAVAESALEGHLAVTWTQLMRSW